MKNILRLALLAALALNLSAQAEPDDTATIAPLKAAKANWRHKLKQFKSMQLKNALSKAGVDDAAIEKVMASMKDLGKEKGAKYKEMKAQFKNEMKKRIMDAGVSAEKADEALKNYKSSVANMRSSVKSALEHFVKDKK